MAKVLESPRLQRNSRLRHMHDRRAQARSSRHRIYLALMANVRIAHFADFHVKRFSIFGFIRISFPAARIAME
ncbi:hypothetical protein TcWFU_010433 [Taenia crassiceps]|uniref:Uncharacterized protein n=1 Tax=Taenia crassiceps TaxID=6207 RepID=A0ABR4QIW4_9CEST